MKTWYVQSGVQVPLSTCIGPLPSTGAYVTQWSSREPDDRLREIQPHPDFLRVAIMLEPLESQVWKDGQPMWGGVIGAHHFRICGPEERGSWTQLSGCDIANVFLPLDTVRRYGALAGMEEDQWPQAQPYTMDRQVSELTRHLLAGRNVQGGLGAHYGDGLVTALLAYLLEHYAVPRSIQSVTALRGLPLRRVLAHIRAQAGQDVYVTELAAMCGMSESHFSREFKRAIGMPPHQYLLKHRLEAACQSLTQTDERIGEIAFTLGFTDASHFSRLFSDRYGMTPTQYRRSHRSAALAVN